MTDAISTTGNASITSTAAQQLLTSLDTGSGIDTASLVTSLVSAQFAAKNAALTKQYDALTAQISGASTLKSNITDFNNALSSLVKGGTLTTQPVSSNTSVLSATALSGAKLSGLTASVTVNQLASAQIAVTRTAFASSSAVVGTGQLTLTLGTASYDADGAVAGFTPGSAAAVTIDIDDSNASLSGIAAAINAKKAGVTASVVTDSDGTAYLSLKGATGAAQAFTLTATTETTGSLSQLNVGAGATGTAIISQAKNAKLVVDGVAVERGSNEISDLVPGVKLNLLTISANAVSLSSKTPTDALANAVRDFVETYNLVFAAAKEQTDAANGPLRADPAARGLLSALQGLSSKVLLPDAAEGTPASLAAIGVRTNRDGTLSVDETTLSAAITKSPDAVEAMFASTSGSSAGISAALSSVWLNATSTVYGLGASSTRYTASQDDITEQQTNVASQSADLTTRLTQQFSSMNAKVAAYKSTQAFLKQQVDAWNASDN